ncbi:nicotinamide mononucleotide adenylyltransferase [Cordyceps javanica]|uniref:Nicotinamide mononucleotide adenylyltransferase n=1 Tax=Cordyceps javanica TaxID=43265 RepID=A0A545V2H4_9HYPO|nr:nicotinamide mononucleotide adenylyltransferase [Cordyceps javanica]TQW06877.1 cytidylyltransferase [Cordyceps javanica]
MDTPNPTTNGTPTAATATNGTTHHATDAAPAPITTMSPYTFPIDKLRQRLTRPGKTPLVLVACGSYSPITVLHVQMFSMAERHVESSAQQRPAGEQHGAVDFEVVGSYLSPVSDAYKKPALAAAHHRLAMCELAAARTDIMVDPWEALRCDANTGEPVYTSTVDVLRHVDCEINRDGGIETSDGLGRVKAQIVLLMGADVAATMGDPKLWPTSDVDAILGQYGAFVIERPMQTLIDEALASLHKYDDKIWVVAAFENDVSSTKIRAQLKNGERVLDLAQPVYEYIKTNDLYHEETGHAKTNGVVQ